MKIRSLILVSVFSVSSLCAQNYFHKIIPFHISDALPNASELILYNNEISIAALVNNDLCTLIHTDFNGSNLHYTDIEDFTFSPESLNVINDELYLYGKDRKISNNLLLVQLDEELDEINRTDYYNDSEFSFPLASISLGNTIHLASIHGMNLTNSSKSNIKKVDLDGNAIWDKEIQSNNAFTMIRDMSVTDNYNLLLSLEVGNPGTGSGVEHQLLKLDSSGNVVWKFIADEIIDNGSVNQELAHLSNSNTVINSKKNRSFELGYGPGELFPFPPLLTWVDDDGQFVRYTLLQSEFNNFIYLNHLSQGKGNYFFGFGRWQDPITEEQYSWLFKMDNEGEMIWNKRYQHPDLLGYDHTLSDILELDNGDIVALSMAFDFNVAPKILLMKVNSNGCFGEEDCHDELIYTDVDDLDISEHLSVYPNPTHSTLIVESEYTGKLDFFDMKGRKILSTTKSKETISIDISQLGNGVINYRLVSSGGVAVGRFIKI